MSNHIHLIVVPGTVHSIARALKDAHGRYAAYFNARYLSSGHVWQGRYYSCPLDPAHLWAALRYTERNPVRAGLVADPEDYRWSSARLHCCTVETDSFVDAALWRDAWSEPGWREYLRGGGQAEEVEAIRRSTHTGRPLGASEFIDRMERLLGRRLRPQPGGRPPKAAREERQEAIVFEE